MAFPILLAAGAGASLAGAGLSAWRKFQLADQQERELAGMKYEDTTPLALRESIATSRMAQGANMPGYNSAANNIMQGTAGQTRALQQNARGSSMIGGLQNLAYAQNRGFSNLANQNAQFQVGERRNLQGLLGQQAQYQESAYQRFMRGRAAMREAIIRNREGAWGDIANSLTGIGTSLGQVGATQMAGQLGGAGAASAGANTGIGAGADMIDQPAWNPNMMGYDQWDRWSNPNRAMFRGSMNRQYQVPMAGYGQ